MNTEEIIELRKDFEALIVLRYGLDDIDKQAFNRSVKEFASKLKIK